MKRRRSYENEIDRACFSGRNRCVRAVAFRRSCRLRIQARAGGGLCRTARTVGGDGSAGPRTGIRVRERLLGSGGCALCRARQLLGPGAFRACVLGAPALRRPPILRRLLAPVGDRRGGGPSPKLAGESACPTLGAYAPTLAGSSFRISDTKALASPKSRSEERRVGKEC